MASLFSRLGLLFEKGFAVELSDEEKLRKERLEAIVKDLSPRDLSRFDTAIINNSNNPKWCANNQIIYPISSEMGALRAKEQTLQECGYSLQTA